MKALKQQINKILEQNNLNFEYNDLYIDNFLKEIQYKYIRHLISDYNVLGVNYKEDDFKFYNLKDKTYLKEYVKNYFSKYSKKDKINELLHKFTIAIDEKYLKSKYSNSLYDYELMQVKNIYNDYINNLNKEIVFNHWCFNIIGDELSDHKIKSFEKDFNKLINLKFGIEKKFTSKYQKNGKVKIKFDDKDFHKKVFKFLIDETFKHFKETKYINIDNINNDNKHLMKRFILFEHGNNLYVMVEVNIFDFEKYKDVLIDKSFNPDIIWDLSKNFKDDDIDNYNYNVKLKQLSEQQQNKIKEFVKIL